MKTCALQTAATASAAKAAAPRISPRVSALGSVASRVPTSRSIPAAAPRAARAARAASVTTVSSAAPGDSAAAPVENVVIIGSGPAGYTAAIYAARANLKPLVFEGFQKGGVRGGQLMTTTEVENFPGFPEGITGPDLMEKMHDQAERWGADLLQEDVDSVDLSERPFTIVSSERTVRANAVIIATGATARRLGIPSEETFWSRGISACAICDGASPIFKNKEVAVVGGGDSATEEAVYLTKYASHVHLLVRGPSMRASKTMQDRALQHPKVTVHYNSPIVDAYPDPKGAMAGLLLKDAETGEERKLPVKGLFYGIGHNPNSDLVKDQVELDEAGYVRVFEGVSTSVEGVYAAGDLQDTEWRQAITAAGSGCMAAISTERYLTEHDLVNEYHRKEEPKVAQKAAAQKAASTSSKKADPLAVATTEETFSIEDSMFKGQFALRKLYHESERLVCVMYTAPTCGPCRSLKPILRGVVGEFPGQIHYVEIDIEEDAEIAEAAGVNGTPTVQFFKDKERIENLPGVKMKSQYRKIITANTETVDAEVNVGA